MAIRVKGDYSKYPQPLQDLFPHVLTEVCDLRELWSVYHRLFMEDQKHTKAMLRGLGPFLGIFQNLAQDEFFLMISRLTDKDSKMQPNLTVWSLRDAAPSSQPALLSSLDAALLKITDAAKTVRKHRNKRIAHLDRDTNMELTPLPVVNFGEIRNVIEEIEAYINLFALEFEDTEFPFGMLSGLDLTEPAEETVHKARAYDLLAEQGVITGMEWIKQLP